METRVDKPHRIEEPRIGVEEKPEYRILCNSEHFLVLNPSRPMKKREGEREPRRKGMLLIKK